jgi:hypothetical protein
MADEVVEFDHDFTDNIICPYCGAEFYDCHEYWNHDAGDGSTMEIDCDICKKIFEVTMNVDVTYSTDKKKETK